MSRRLQDLFLGGRWLHFGALSLLHVLRLHTHSSVHQLLLFQIKNHVGPSKFQLPLSCPAAAAFGPSFPASPAAPTSSAMLPPARYLMSSCSYGRAAPGPGPLYSQQWAGVPCVPSPTGLLGIGRMMPFAAMASPGVKAYPLVMHDVEHDPRSNTSRTT